MASSERPQGSFPGIQLLTAPAPLSRLGQLSRERWKHLRGFMSRAVVFILGYSYGGGGGRTGNEGKDAQLLLFQNRFWKLPEEKVHGKKRCGTAEVNIKTMKWEESLGW